MLAKWVGPIILAVVAAGAAYAQDLPSEVADPYIAYTQALEAEDYAAARDAALEAWRAGQLLDIDPDTLVILVDNYGQLASALGDHEAARDAYREVAEYLDQIDGDVTLAAQMWILAARSAIAAGDTRDAIRCADAAGDRADQARDLDDNTRAALTFNSRAIQAQALWREGQAVRAAYRAHEALDAADGHDLAGNANYGLVTFIVGADYAMERDFENAAFYLSEAYAYMPDQRRALGIWVRMAREALDSTERARLLERIAAADFPESDRSPTEDPDDPVAHLEAAGEFVDATPVRRGAPSYPAAATYGDFDGVAVIEFTINENGRVEDPEVVITIPFRDFGEAAISAVRRWRYEPATLDGVPVRRPGVVTQFEFVMDD